MFRSVLVSSAILATIAIALLAACSPEYRHDPEPYRAKIEEIETLLTKTAPEPGDGGKLHTLCADLAGLVGPDIELHTNRQTVQNLIITVGEVYAHAEEQDLPWTIEDARESWKGMRDAIFLPADWYQTF